MGLDTYEFVVEIEEEYSISIPDEDTVNLGVLGDLARYVSNKTTGTPNEYTYEQVLRKLISMLEENYGVPVGKANAQSHVVKDLGLD